MQNKPDIELAEAAAGGDIGSFGELCERYYAAMAAVAYAVLGDHQLAEDAAQESFARALVRIRGLKDRAKFGPWLAAICRNVARDMVAARARQISADDLANGKHDGSDIEDIYAVRRAIGQLPAPARELIVLRYYDGLSHEEISSVLGISKAAINGRLTRAKTKMAQYLRRSRFVENEL